MIYDYKCEKCNEIIEKDIGMLEFHPKTIECTHCGEKAFRYFGVSFHIPETFRATSEQNSDSSTSLDNLKQRFAHSHPSGRDSKIYY